MYKIFSNLLAIALVPVMLSGSAVVLPSAANMPTGKTTEVINFSEQNIAPGFNKTYSLPVDNSYGTDLAVLLDYSSLGTSNALLEKLTFTIYNQDGAVVAVLNQSTSGTLLGCVKSGENADFALNLAFDQSAGNETQGLSANMAFRLRLDPTTCPAN